MYEEILGKKCIVRSHDAGVHYGTVAEVNGETVRMKDVRNIWYWEGANCLADIAAEGVGVGSKVSRVVASMVLNRCCQIIPCTGIAIQNLDNIRVWSC